MGLDIHTEAVRDQLALIKRVARSTRGQPAGVGEQWRTEIERDPTLRRARIVIELVFGGDTVVRLATEPLEATSNLTGDKIVYLPQLQDEPEVERGYEIGKPDSEVLSVSFVLDSTDVDPAALVGRGRFLAGYGEVSLQLPGGVHEQRIIIVAGEMTGGVAFGTKGEELSVEISDPKLAADLLIPPWVADSTRHADIGGDWVGERYPIVFGTVSGVEAIRVDDPTAGGAPELVVAFDHGHTVSTVYQNGGTPAAGSLATDSTDDLGTSYRRVVFLSPTGFAEDDVFHVDLVASDDYGLIGNIEALLQRFSVLGTSGLSRDLFSRAASRMPRLDTQILVNGSAASDEAGALSYVEKTVCESFPMISMAWDRGRYGPIVSDYRIRQPSAKLVAGSYPLVDRVSLVAEVPREDVASYFELVYDYNPVTGRYAKMKYRSPANDQTCQLARTLTGARYYGGGRLESQLITQPADADYVLDWLVAHMAVPSYRVTWTCHPWVWLYLLRGDPVWFTDPDFGWTNERALVEGLSYQRGRATVTLRVYPGRAQLSV